MMVGRLLSFWEGLIFRGYVSFGDGFGQDEVMTDSLSRLAKLISNEICLPLRHQIVAKPRLSQNQGAKRRLYLMVASQTCENISSIDM